MTQSFSRCHRYTATVFAALTFVELIAMVCLFPLRMQSSSIEPKKDELRIQLAAHNLPFKEEYRNVTKAFPRTAPVNFPNWKPHPNSYQYFQPMENKDAWVYSTFWDITKAKGGQPTIVSFGIARKPLPWRIFCHFHHETIVNKFVTKPGFMQRFWEDHNTSVVPFIMECKIPKGLTPKTVSFTFNSNNKMTNNLQIQYPGPRLRKFTVCYSALHSTYNDTSRLIQSIVFNRIMGAEHFVFYNFSISKETDNILRYYMAKGLATVHQWPLPTLETWYLGQIAIINDCLFRNRNVSEFVALVDTDELIVPRRHDSWSEMIKAIEGNRSLEDFTLNPFSKSNKKLTGSKSSNNSHMDLQPSGHIIHEGNTTNASQTTDSPTNEQVGMSYKSYHLPVDGSKKSEEKKNPAEQSRKQENYNSTFRDTVLSNSTQGDNITNGDKTEKGIGSFVFKSTFFPSNLINTRTWENVKREFSISKDEEYFLKRFLVLPITDYMKGVTFDYRRRSKVIVRPELVERAGIHFMFRHVRWAREVRVREDVALVHHYRRFTFGRHFREDLSALRFKQQFLSALKVEFTALKYLV